MSSHDKSLELEELQSENERLREKLAALEGPIPLLSTQELSLIVDVFNAAEDAIFIKDPEGKYLIINEVGAKFLGRTVAECIGRDDFALFPKESAHLIREVDLKAMARETPYMVEEAVMTALGQITFLSIKGPFRNPEGTVIGMFGHSRDITARKHAEECLRLSEERLKLAQAAGGFGTYDWDLVEQRGTCSQKYRHHFGFEPDGIMPSYEAGLARIHPEDQARISAAVERIKADNDYFSLDYRIVLKGKPLRWVADRASITFDEDGKALRVVGVTYDITDSKMEAVRLESLVAEQTSDLNEALSALRLSESRYRSLFNGLEEGLLVQDQEGAIIDCNQVICTELGYTSEELLSMSSRDIEMLHEDMEASSLADCGYTREGCHRTRSGQMLQVEIHCSAIQYHGAPAILSVSRNISERKEAEEQRRVWEEKLRQTQKLESLGLLAGGIAHDFNNILMGIMGHAELAAEMVATNHPARHDLNGIVDASLRAASLCNQMLAYSGKGQFLIQPIDLNDTVLKIADLVGAGLSGGTEILFDLDPDLPPIEADEAQITQLVLNLMTNGVEAIGEAPGTLRITTSALDCTADSFGGTLMEGGDVEPGRYVVLVVEDNGVGMDKDTQEKIFDPFFTTKFTGRGLGLAAVLGIVRGHQGTLNVESTRNEGTCFTVYLPQSLLDIVDADSPPPALNAMAGPCRILLVDDEASVLEVGRRMLEFKDFEVCCAKNGAEAIELFRRDPSAIDCVILDQTMPGLSGLETCRILREIQPTLPVLISSGYTNEDVIERDNQSLQVGFIQKPYRVEQLHTKVCEMIGSLDDE